ncbi:hypothetical protein, partial [Cellulophaga sp. Z1A5H]|uniref:hypothetical protein n=1 Tax=Cellulophaga sp. Z1A5H TaxID=2687291 RepID=UPI0013FD27ED
NSKELTDNPYFNFIIYSKPEWINTKFKLAKPYYINNSKSELITLLGEHIYDDSYNEDYNTHLLSYNPSVLFSNSGPPKITDFETVISSDTLEILKSAHSIIKKKKTLQMVIHHFR